MCDALGNDRMGADGDAFYEALMKAHEGLTEAESNALNMRLVLILANEVSSLQHLNAAITTAKENQ
ncbi:MAG: DUF2783 domain-containing protein [Pseudomonadota bacterium]